MRHFWYTKYPRKSAKMNAIVIIITNPSVCHFIFILIIHLNLILQSNTPRLQYLCQFIKVMRTRRGLLYVDHIDSAEVQPHRQKPGHAECGKRDRFPHAQRSAFFQQCLTLSKQIM